MSKEFGIYPSNNIPRLWWGARAIISKREIDIPVGRYNFDGDREATDFRNFFNWIENDAIKKLNDKVKSFNNKNISFDSDDGNYHCEADSKNSGGGYLYIGCWSNK